MSHAIYQTNAVILATKNMRESNKLLVLYTEKFGLLYVSTQSIRELKSKMRYHANLYSMVQADVVQGRDIWRLTGIHEEQSSLSFVATPWYDLIHRISSIIVRLCNGEEANEKIWVDIHSMYDLLEENLLSEKEYQFFEIIFITRLLSHLGYWEGNEEYIHDSNPFRGIFYTMVEQHKPLIIKKINAALQDSQL